MLMSRQTTMIGALALGCSMTLQAQTPTGREPNRTMPASITLTGCVERADQVSGAVTAGTTVDSLSFVLIKATKGTAADARTTGTAESQSSADKGSMYRLDADVATLNPHEGHKDEVTGTLVTANAPPADGVDPSSASNAPKVKVTQVKMLSETCGR
jgi:hypothetical protein